MLQLGRCVRIGVAIGLSAVVPVTASAGDLKAPTIAASVAAAADWASTYHALKHYELREKIRCCGRSTGVRERWCRSVR